MPFTKLQKTDDGRTFSAVDAAGMPYFGFKLNGRTHDAWRSRAEARGALQVERRRVSLRQQQQAEAQ